MSNDCFALFWGDFWKPSCFRRFGGVKNFWTKCQDVSLTYTVYGISKIHEHSGSLERIYLIPVIGKLSK